MNCLQTYKHNAGDNSWKELKDLLKQNFEAKTYNGWLSKLRLVSLTDNEIVMSVPTSFIKDWITREFLYGVKKTVDGKKVWLRKGLVEIFKQKHSGLKSFKIIVDKNRKTKEIEEGFEDKVSSISEHENLYVLGAKLNPEFTFDNLAVGSSNRLAFSVAKSVAESIDIGLNTNPFFVYGGIGLGKTHLLQAIAWKLKERNPKQNIVYLSAEKFMYLFIQALRSQSIMKFKERFTNIDVLLIDDIHFIAGKDSTQKEFFYVFNALINDGKQIILVCDKSHNDLVGVDEKLKSRISGGVVADVYAPDYEMRLEIAKKKAKMVGLNCSDEILEYIAENIRTNGRDIDGAVKKILLHQKFMDGELGLEIVKTLLKDLLRSINKTVNVAKIQQTVAEHFRVNRNDLNSKRRDKKFTLPRQVAMYLSKIMTTKSLADIGKAFGNRNHATVIHSVRKIEELKQADFEISQTIQKIFTRLKR